MAQTNDIAIDLGTSNVIIYMKGKGIVFREPCVVAVDRETNNIIAFGQEAYRMIGRTPANVNIIRPLAQGEMLDFELTGHKDMDGNLIADENLYINVYDRDDDHVKECIKDISILECN